MTIDINQAHPSEISKLNEQKLKIDDFNQNVIKKSMIRYLTIIVDFTKASIKQDYRPNKATVVKENVENFLQNFYDLNPMSKVSIIATLKEKAIIISSYTNSKAEAMINLNSINEFEGCPSYQNALELSLK